MDYHIPVMLKETIELLNPSPKGFWLDATGGAGGHSKEILKRIIPDGKLIFMDRDAEAIEEAQKNLAEYEGYVIYVQDNFSNALNSLREMNIPSLSGALFDLGISSHQIDDAGRGFSFMQDGRLDMRMDKGQFLNADTIINTYAEEELANIIYEFGEERLSRRIASNIVRNRPILTTQALAEIVNRSVPHKFRISSLARVFQAIRIKVNGELESLEKGLKDVTEMVEKGGRIAVLSYHSLEDRIVKNYFRKESTECICDGKVPECRCGHIKILSLVTRKPVMATEEEISINTRSRSAKLRVAERI